MKRRIILILFFYLAILQISIAQQFYTQVATTSLPMGQTLEIAFVSEGLNVSSIEVPKFRDFDIVGGPNISSSTTIINSKISQINSWSYYLQPKHTGICKIEKAKAILKYGNEAFSQEIDINVTNGNTPTTSNASPLITNTSSNNKNFFIKVIPNKKSVYIGEEIMLTYKIYSNLPFKNGKILSNNTFNNFSIIEIKDNVDNERQNEIINGKPYLAITSLKVLLSAEKAGIHKIAPVDYNVEVKKKNSDFIEQFFGEDFEDIYVKSDEISIEVKELPQPIPTNFCSAIGDFKIACTLNKNTANTNEPFTYKIAITGNGNFKNISAPELIMDPSFEVYDPVRKENSVAGFVNEVSYEYLITPHEPGDYKIAPANFTYFSTAENKYATLNGDSLPLTITGKSTPYTKANKTATKNIDIEITNQKNIGDIVSSKNSIISSQIYYITLSSPLFLMLGFILFKLVKKSINTPKPLNKSSIISSIENLKQKENSKDIYKEANAILISFLNHKFPTEDFSSISKTSTVLQQNKISIELENKIIHHMENNEKNLYAPIVNSAETNQMLDELKQIINELENSK